MAETDPRISRELQIIKQSSLEVAEEEGVHGCSCFWLLLQAVWVQRAACSRERVQETCTFIFNRLDFRFQRAALKWLLGGVSCGLCA